MARLFLCRTAAGADVHLALDSRFHSLRLYFAFSVHPTVFLQPLYCYFRFPLVHACKSFLLIQNSSSDLARFVDNDVGRVLDLEYLAPEWIGSSATQAALPHDLSNLRGKGETWTAVHARNFTYA
jgi:hypothetical protein